MAFSTTDGTPGDPTIDLRITGPTTFELLDGFVYTDEHDPTRPRVEVEAGMDTDLASVPFFLQWLVRSYGKHTRAALVHDWLWQLDALRPPSRLGRLRLANRLFRDAMKDGDVALVRRWLIWSAVSVAMFVRLGLARWAQLALWGAASVVVLGSLIAAIGWTVAWRGPLLGAAALVVTAAAAAIVALVAHMRHDEVLRGLAVQVTVITLAYAALFIALTGISQSDVVRDRWPLVALVALAIAGLACVPDWPAGFIATIAVVIVAVPVTAGFAALGLYGLIELGVFGLRRLWNAEVTAPATPSMVRHGSTTAPDDPPALTGLAPGA